MNIRRQELELRPDPRRVLLRPFMASVVVKPTGHAEPSRRLLDILARVLTLDDATVEATLENVLHEFHERHEDIRAIFLDRFNKMAPLLPVDGNVGESRKLLIGSYFTNEYSLESSALFNPSIVPAPDQSGLAPGELRFILSLRATGEGHISSITFRSGIAAADGSAAPCRVLLRSCHSGGQRYVQLRINDTRSRARRVDEVRRLNEILERRVAERTAELEQTNQELEAFSYSVSHDLRTPLRHVMGFANLLRQQTGQQLDPVQLQHLNSITAAGERMNQLIDDLLAFSRIGRAELHRRRVDLTGLVQTARQDLAAETAGRVIEWAVHPLPAVQADPSLLRQAVVNLVSNALKFTASREPARIEIGSSSIDPGKTVIYVRDNGVGFDPRYAGKLFGVFQRLHNGRDFEGTGIGLANVRQIIRRHGGRVWAEGKPGEGATFYFSLPRTEGTPRA